MTDPLEVWFCYFVLGFHWKSGGWVQVVGYGGGWVEFHGLWVMVVGGLRWSWADQW